MHTHTQKHQDTRKSVGQVSDSVYKTAHTEYYIL